MDGPHHSVVKPSIEKKICFQITCVISLLNRNRQLRTIKYLKQTYNIKIQRNQTKSRKKEIGKNEESRKKMHIHTQRERQRDKKR